MKISPVSTPSILLPPPSGTKYASTKRQNLITVPSLPSLPFPWQGHTHSISSSNSWETRMHVGWGTYKVKCKEPGQRENPVSNCDYCQSRTPNICFVQKQFPIYRYIFAETLARQGGEDRQALASKRLKYKRKQ